MNLEQAAQFVKNPQELNLSHAGSLKNLSDKHPYTSVYPLLYLTALANGKSPDLDEALAKYAYKISDRTRLYHLLKGPAASEGPKVPAAQEGPETLLESSVEPEVLLDTPSRSEDIPPRLADTIEAQSQSEAEALSAAPESSEDLPKQIADSDQPQSDLPADRKTEAEIGFDFESVTTAHSLEQYLEVEATPEQQAEAAGEEEDQEIKTENPEEEKQEAAPSGMKSFGSWLKSGNSPSKAPVKPAEKPKADVLIEKFIQEEPSISRNKKEFFSPSRKAKESLNEDAVPVSETLARIYAAQGNYPKAIHVYHQLMLSIPEKKSFFAIQIEELKQKITS